MSLNAGVTAALTQASLSGPQSGITFGGLSSGIDTTSIIQKLVQVESAPISNYQSQLAALQSKQGVLATLKSDLQAIATAAGALNAQSAFNPVTASSSDTTVATLTGSSNAAAGVYNLIVTQLAQTQKIASGAQTDSTSALNLSGTFVINGKSVQVAAGDSLKKIAQSINGANAGVTASIIDGGSGSAYLTINANSSGLSNKIQLADTSGSVLSSLGVVSGAATARETITNGVTSFNFASSSQTISQMLPGTGITTGSFQVNGNTVNVDFNTDTLQTLAAKITAAGGNASVRTVTDSSGNSTYKLDIINGGGNDFSDPQNMLQALGVLQQPYGSELIQAQDAKYSLDGVNLTSSSNTITTAIPGATLTLLKGTPSSPSSSTLTLAKDTGAIVNNIQNFVDAYNAAIDFVNQNSTFDSTTYQTGALFGDPTAQQVVSSAATILFQNAPGSISSYKNLASVGFSLDKDGKIALDQDQLKTAITNSPDSLNSLFQTVGSTSDPNLTYITVGSAGKSGTYAVNVTAAPTYASYTAAVGQASPTSTQETLTFTGSLFPSMVALNVPVGSDQTAVVNLINSDTRLSPLVQAGVDSNGHLQITSKKAGTIGNFNVSSNLGDTTGDTSGVGSGADGTKVAGTDIQGTINGELATGGPNGMLTGNSGNLHTDGVQVQYSGTSTGVVGNVTVNKGIAALINDMVGTFTDPVSGLLTARDQSFTAQETDINNSITALQARVATLQSELQTKFANMETTMAQLQQQGAQITSYFNSTSSSKSG